MRYQCEWKNNHVSSITISRQQGESINKRILEKNSLQRILVLKMQFINWQPGLKKRIFVETCCSSNKRTAWDDNRFPYLRWYAVTSSSLPSSYTSHHEGDKLKMAFKPGGHGYVHFPLFKKLLRIDYIPPHKKTLKGWIISLQWIIAIINQCWWMKI